MNNKTMFKWLATVVIAMLAILGLARTTVEATANDGHLTDVIITKVKTDDGLKDMDLEDLANGVDLDTWFTDAEPLAGISFSWYEVNDTQLAALKANPGDFDTPAKMAAAGYVLGGATGETNAAGRVTISDLAEGNYWIVENGKSIIADSRAVPFGLTLPFTNLTRDGWLDKIYVYPKNTLQDVPVDPEKEVDEVNNAIGELHTWKITQAIPLGIADYETFGFIDEIDARLDFEGVASVEVNAPGVTLGAGDYVVNYDDTAGQLGLYGIMLDKPLTGTLTVYFTEAGLAKLAEATGDLTIEFDTRINDKAIMGLDIYNNVVLDFDNGHGDDGKYVPEEPPFVHTGGKAFIKKDGVTHEIVGGAEFKITNADGLFVKVGAGGAVTFGADTEDSPATVFTSDAITGMFEVKGLPYGDYVLIETKAPPGYALPTNPNTNFTVDATSYYLDPTDVALGDPSDNSMRIDNRRLTIPQTGGMGTMAFTIIGSVLMLFSVAYYRKSSKA